MIQLSGRNGFYSDFKESDLVKLVEKSNTMFQSLKIKYLIIGKELKYSSYQYKIQLILINVSLSKNP